MSDTDSILHQMNDRHFVVSVQGRTVVGTIKDRWGKDIPLTFSSFQHFRERYSNHMVKTRVGTDAKGKPKYKDIPKGTWWLNNPNRKQYDRVGYWPKTSAPNGAFNLWRGFAMPPKPGDWSIMQDHLHRNVCRGDDALYEYVRKWMAFAVQQPAIPPGVALVLRGTKGSGKSIVANTLGKLFGVHYMPLSNADHVTGKFNAHFQNITLLFIDEGFWAGDKKRESVLKALITEPILPIERKFFDVENSPNCLHVIMASNEPHVVPARSLERRFLVLDVGDGNVQDTIFFRAMHEQLENGGYAGMLDDLLKEDISQFEVRRAPRTEALLEQMIHSLNPFEEWWYGKLRDGLPLPEKNGWVRVMAKALYKNYREESEDKHPMTESRFGLELRRWMPNGFRRVRASNASTGNRPWMYEFPPLEECRAEWERQHGLKVNWDDDPEQEGEA